MADRRRYCDIPAPAQLDTLVIDVGEENGRPWVRLEETIFHPEGGGQPSDRGTIGGVPVVDVQARGERVLHFLERPIPCGPVATAVDAGRRFDYSQQHTAQHLLTALLADRHRRATTSFHLGETYAAVEVTGNVPSPATVEAWEDEVNAMIRRDPPVRSRWVEPPELERLEVRTRGLPEGHVGPVRLVEIEGIDLNTCGGTHVMRLAELQVVRLVGVEAARGGVRVRYLAGGRVLRRLREADALEAQLKERIGTAPAEFARVLDGWQAERKRLERTVRELERELAARVGAEIAAAPGDRLARFLEGAGPEYLRAVAAAVLERRPEATVVLVGRTGEPPQACFLVQAGPRGEADVSAIGQCLCERMGAKGGGKGRLFQGRGGVWDGGDPVL